MPNIAATTLQRLGLVHGLVRLFNKMCIGTLITATQNNTNAGRGPNVVLKLHLAEGMDNFFGNFAGDFLCLHMLEH